MQEIELSSDFAPFRENSYLSLDRWSSRPDIEPMLSQVLPDSILQEGSRSMDGESNFDEFFELGALSGGCTNEQSDGYSHERKGMFKSSAAVNLSDAGTRHFSMKLLTSGSFIFPRAAGFMPYRL